LIDDTKASVSEKDNNKNNISKMQFMVTNRMREILIEELNYLESEVEMIEPQIAAVVIERGLSRPSAGMPPSWKKTNVSPLVNLPKKKSTNKLFNPLNGIIKSIKFMFNKTKYILPVIAGYLFLTKSGNVNFENFKFEKVTPKINAFKFKSPNKKNPNLNLNSLDSMIDKFR